MEQRVILADSARRTAFVKYPAKWIVRLRLLLAKLLHTLKALPAVGGGTLLLAVGAEVAVVATEIAVLKQWNTSGTSFPLQIESLFKRPRFVPQKTKRSGVGQTCGSGQPARTWSSSRVVRCTASVYSA